MTSIPGSSRFYDGSAVSYSYQAKEDLLQVDKNTLESLGAVSEEIVIQMAKGALKNIKSDYTIAVSGIMGPDGGTPDKPAGTVWVAVGNKEKIEARKLYFRFDRTRNTTHCCQCIELAQKIHPGRIVNAILKSKMIVSLSLSKAD